MPFATMIHPVTTSIVNRLVPVMLKVYGPRVGSWGETCATGSMERVAVLATNSLTRTV